MKRAKQALTLLLALLLTAGAFPAFAAQAQETAETVEETTAEASEEEEAPKEEPRQEDPHADPDESVNETDPDDAPATEGELPAEAGEEEKAPGEPEAVVSSDLETQEASDEDTAETLQPEPEEEETEQPESVIEGETLELAIPELPDGADNQELFRQYVEKMLAPGNGAPVRRKIPKNPGNRLTGNNGVVYAKLKQYITQVAEGERSSTEFEISLEDLGVRTDGWTASSLGVSSVVANGKMTPQAHNAMAGKIQFDYALVMNALLSECPYELYWYDKTVKPTTSGLSYVAEYNLLKHEYVLRYSSDSFTLCLPVAAGFAANSPYRVDSSVWDTVETVKFNVKLLLPRYSPYSDYEKLDNYRDLICRLVSYDYSAAQGASYGNPWQLLWVFDDDPNTNVVCEGYAKAFQYLCDRTDFDGNICCYTVTGNMTSNIAGRSSSGPHMWNIVTMGDGQNYLVDVTNCDTGPAGGNDLLFLAGCTGGSVERGYTYRCQDGTVTYTYDDYTKRLYNRAELEMSGRAYLYEPGKQEQTDLKTCTVAVENVTYSAKAMTPPVTVRFGSKVLTGGTDYDVVYSNNVNAGTATVTAYGKGGYTGSVSQTFQIRKTEQTLSVKAASSLIAGKSATITAKGAGAITYASSNNKVASVSPAGVITAKTPGTVTITVKAAGDGNYYPASKTVKVKVACAAPALTKVEGVNGGVKLTWGKVAGAAKYRIFYKTGKGGWKKLADTASTSYTWKKAKKGTKYSFTVRCLNKNGKGYTSGYDKKGKTLTYIATPVLSKVQNTKAGVKLTWKKSAGAAKYRVLRKTGKGKWVKVGDTTKLTFVDKKAKKDVRYTYTVRCVTKNGKSFTSGYNTKGLRIKRK